MDIGLGVEQTNTSFTSVLYQGSKFLLLSNDNAIDWFSTFDPHQDVKVRMVVAMETDDID